MHASAINTFHSSVCNGLALQKFGSRGWLDFYIHQRDTGAGRWAIECLVRGSKGEEHVQGFAEQGLCSEISYTEHALVDFRSGPTAPMTLRSDCVYVSFNAEYTEAVIRSSGRPSKKVRLA